MGDHLSNTAAPALNDLSFLSRRRYTCQLAEKDFLLSFCFVYLVYSMDSGSQVPTICLLSFDTFAVATAVG